VVAVQIGARVSRRRETAVRIALGATPRQLAREVALESVAIAIVGGAVGLTAYWLLVALIASRVPLLNLAPDVVTVVFAVAISGLVGLLASLVPAGMAARVPPALLLKAAGTGTTRVPPLQQRANQLQIALSTSILVGLLLVVTQSSPSTGLEAGGMALYTSRVRVDWSLAGTDRPAFERRLLGALSAVSKNPHVAEVVPVPPGGIVQSRLRGGSSTVTASLRRMTPRYLELMGVRFAEGRGLQWADTLNGEDAVIVSESLARTVAPQRSAVGLRVAMLGLPARASESALVVGVVADRGLDIGAERVDAASLIRGRSSWAEYLVRTKKPAEAVIPGMVATIDSAWTGAPLIAKSFTQLEEEAQAASFWLAAFLLGLALVSIAVVSVGLFSATHMAAVVGRRELGTRIALGAVPMRATGILVRRSLVASGGAIAVGALVSVAAVVVSTANREVVWQAVWIAGLVSLVLTVLVALTSWIPALQASRMDPAEVLRNE
jgi:hypothetical protein